MAAERKSFKSNKRVVIAKTFKEIVFTGDEGCDPEKEDSYNIH